MSEQEIRAAALNAAAIRVAGRGSDLRSIVDIARMFEHYIRSGKP